MKFIVTPDSNQDQAAPSQLEESQKSRFWRNCEIECALQLLVMSATAGLHTGLFGVVRATSNSRPERARLSSAEGLKLLVRDAADGDEGNGTVPRGLCQRACGKEVCCIGPSASTFAGRCLISGHGINFSSSSSL